MHHFVCHKINYYGFKRIVESSLAAAFSIGIILKHSFCVGDDSTLFPKRFKEGVGAPFIVTIIFRGKIIENRNTQTYQKEEKKTVMVVKWYGSVQLQDILHFMRHNKAKSREIMSNEM